MDEGKDAGGGGGGGGGGDSSPRVSRGRRMTKAQAKMVARYNERRRSSGEIVPPARRIPAARSTVIVTDLASVATRPALPVRRTNGGEGKRSTDEGKRARNAESKLADGDGYVGLPKKAGGARGARAYARDTASSLLVEGRKRADEAKAAEGSDKNKWPVVPPEAAHVLVGDRLECMLSLLDGRSIVRCRRVCRQWKAFTAEEDLWERLVDRHGWKGWKPFHRAKDQSWADHYGALELWRELSSTRLNSRTWHAGIQLLKSQYTMQSCVYHDDWERLGYHDEDTALDKAIRLICNGGKPPKREKFKPEEFRSDMTNAYGAMIHQANQSKIDFTPLDFHDMQHALTACDKIERAVPTLLPLEQRYALLGLDEVRAFCHDSPWWKMMHDPVVGARDFSPAAVAARNRGEHVPNGSHEVVRRELGLR